MSVDLAEDAEGWAQGASRVSLRNPIVFQCDLRAANSRVIRGPPLDEDVNWVGGSLLNVCKLIGGLKRDVGSIRPDRFRDETLEPYFQKLRIRLGDDEVAPGGSDFIIAQTNTQLLEVRLKSL